ncbi:hypothetical protein CVT26_006700 [Gymnopilus dilepis]|uniref:Uncharacterized protein n=1 Tax=Gymnopilus dilepis TaxID=231916 RepID=A0A409WQB9_9AGAR|nr:hypothetical protein CVT26_006700 [Gymnopilus dilepis]
MVDGGGVTSGKRNAFIPETRSVPLVSSPPPPSPSFLSLLSSPSLWLGREPLPSSEGTGPAFVVGWGCNARGDPSRGRPGMVRENALERVRTLGVLSPPTPCISPLPVPPSLQSRAGGLSAPPWSIDSSWGGTRACGARKHEREGWRPLSCPGRSTPTDHPPS